MGCPRLSFQASLNNSSNSKTARWQPVWYNAEKNKTLCLHRYTQTLIGDQERWEVEGGEGAVRLSWLMNNCRTQGNSEGDWLTNEEWAIWQEKTKKEEISRWEIRECRREDGVENRAAVDRIFMFWLKMVKCSSAGHPGFFCLHITAEISKYFERGAHRDNPTHFHRGCSCLTRS